MTESNHPVLYILMRNDMDSMNAGKGMAQASHASNAFVKKANERVGHVGMETLPGTADITPKREINMYNQFQAWQNATKQGFGTVLVLAVNEDEMETAISIAQRADYIADVVHDPTYPLRDGAITHLLPINTCGYIFCAYDDVTARAIVQNFPLHP